MPAELMHLNEQLLNIKIIYEDAIRNDRPLAELKRLSNQLKEIEKAIEARKEYISRNQSTN